jgi:hypothetical protein
MPFCSHLRAMGSMAAIDALAHPWRLRERAVPRIEAAHG